MIKNDFLSNIQSEITELKNLGLYKGEYHITSKQSAVIELKDGSKMLNFCANNYLGLADNPELLAVAKNALDQYGYGTASVRFICGTMDVHRKMEIEMAKFVGFEDCISFASCWSANNGIFGALLTQEDSIISANLNHASLIDGIRLSKAQRFFYQFDDMADLEAKIKEACNTSKYKMIVTDGVFSMDGDIAPLEQICDLAEKYDCMLLVDDSHATGFIGKNGRGTHELCNVEGRVDILTSTLGKALGGSGGGIICTKKEIVEKLRNTARPYLFSNNLSPVVATVTLHILAMLKKNNSAQEKLMQNTSYFRQKMMDAGFNIRLGVDGIHPIAPVMLGDAKLADTFAKEMMKEGVYVIAFSYPVVPKNEARIRVQNSSSHSKEQLDFCIDKFIKVGKTLQII